MEGAAVALCTQHYKTMIMQHLYDASTYKKLDVNIDMKTHKKFEKFLHKYSKCFAESEQIFLNGKSFEASNFYDLTKIHKSKVMEATIHSQNTYVVEVWQFQIEASYWWAKLSNKNTLLFFEYNC